MSKCKTCDKPTVGKSSYCAEHKAIARQKWLAMVRESTEKREKLNDKWQALFDEGVHAGNNAAAACVPSPMVVQQHKNQLDDNSPVEKEYFVSEGLCGFAWVVIHPGTCSFARWLLKNRPNDCGKDYYGGLAVYPSLNTQSVDRKESWARTVCKIFGAAGINCQTRSRLD